MSDSTNVLNNNETKNKINHNLTFSQKNTYNFYPINGSILDDTYSQNSAALEHTMKDKISSFPSDLNKIPQESPINHISSSIKPNFETLNNNSNNNLNDILNSNNFNNNDNYINQKNINNNLNNNNSDIDSNTINNNDTDPINLNDIIIDTSKTKTPLKKILKLRESLFKEEFKRIPFTYTTSVEYKLDGYQNSYKKSTLLLLNQKLYLLPLIKNNTNKNIKKNKKINNDTSLIKMLETSDNFPQKESIPIKYDISYPLISLNFDLITCTILRNKKNPLIIIIKILGLSKYYKHKYISIKFNSKEISDKFSHLISLTVINSLGYQTNLLGISIRFNNFFTMNVISCTEFENTANTGDILIFRANTCPAPLQRCYTGDPYDHVALIKKEGGFLTIYDATSVGKCNSTYWDIFKYNLIPLLYEKIVYRKLNIYESNYLIEKNIRDEINKKANEFINLTKKKEYYLSLKSLVCCCGKKPYDYEKKFEWDKSEGYSCSSLLTAAYYHLGIIKMKKGVHSILPGDFGQLKNIFEFNEKFSLGPEKLIEFTIK